MELHLRLDGSGDLSRRLHRELRAGILAGRLRRGDRLPPTRELARRLGVARGTAGLAYEWLLAEGLVETRGAAGTFVAADPVARTPRRAGVPLRTRAVWNRIALPPAPGPSPRFDFAVGVPDAGLFPSDEWRRLLAREQRAPSVETGYGDPRGDARLREAIARHVSAARGVLARAEDVVVTHGAQAAFDLVARVLVDDGTRVAVEEPGYPPARLLFASHGARVSGVAVDGEGLDAARLPNDARLVHTTPSHQFPLGMPMSERRRAALLDWAERRNALVLEDDYDSEFRFGGRPLETLHALDRSGRVIYVGSFSKTLLPSLRLGFLVAPQALHAALRAASALSGGPPPAALQGALARLLESGRYARHVRRARRVYEGRHRRVLDALSGDLAPWLEPLVSATGLHVAALLRSRDLRREREIASRALAAGVRFDRLSASYAEGSPRPGLVLGYGAISDARLDEGLRRLGSAVAAVLRG